MQREAREGRTIWVAHCAEKRRWHAQESHQHMHLEDGVVNSDVSICDANGIARALAALVPSDGRAHPVVMSLSRGVGVPVALEEFGERPGAGPAARPAARRVPGGFASILDEIAVPAAGEAAIWDAPQDVPVMRWTADAGRQGQIMMRPAMPDNAQDPSAHAAAQAAAIRAEIAEQGPEAERIAGCDCAECAVALAEIREETAGTGTAW